MTHPTAIRNALMRLLRRVALCVPILLVASCQSTATFNEASPKGPAQAAAPPASEG